MNILGKEFLARKGHNWAITVHLNETNFTIPNFFISSTVPVVNLSKKNIDKLFTVSIYLGMGDIEILQKLSNSKTANITLEFLSYERNPYEQWEFEYVKLNSFKLLNLDHNEIKPIVLEIDFEVPSKVEIVKI